LSSRWVDECWLALVGLGLPSSARSSTM
jgi:hypothetical protein